MLHLPRIFHKWYANRMRYFWHPCPLCGRMFGGHETEEAIFISSHRGICVCLKCSKEARKLNTMHGFPSLESKKEVG